MAFFDSLGGAGGFSGSSSASALGRNTTGGVNIGAPSSAPNITILIAVAAVVVVGMFVMRR